MSEARAIAAHSADKFGPFTFPRRDLEPQDVRIEILYCGVCHSDVHFARGEWGDPHYPCVPGHEIVGRISEVGASVSEFATGDIVGVGCMVDSCRTCGSCQEGVEQFCEHGFTGTYGGFDKKLGLPTYGGYSDHIVVPEHFAVRVRHDPSQLAAVAPLLCAGITVYSPLRHWNTGPGKKVGIVGIGGLGHMGVKIADALGATVVAFTSSPHKIEEAKRLGADDVLIVTDPDAVAAHTGTFDLILNTVSASQNLDSYVQLLKRDGTLVLLGAGTEQHIAPGSMNLIFKRRSLAGSLIGGMAETQEMLDFCAEHGIVADIELIDAASVETAYERMLKSDVKYRFVIDMASLPAAA